MIFMAAEYYSAVFSCIDGREMLRRYDKIDRNGVILSRRILLFSHKVVWELFI